MRHYKTIEERYADEAPKSLIDPITHCVFCDPVVSPSTGNTYSRKTVVDFGMKDPCSMETIEKLIPNRNKQEEIERFYQDKFKEAVDYLVTKSIDENVEQIVELIAMVVDRSNLQVCLNGQRLLIELIQSSTDDQLGRFKAQLNLSGLRLVAQLMEKQNATILKHRLSIDVNLLTWTSAMLPSQLVSIVPDLTINDSDDDEEYDFSDTESTTSSVCYTDDKTDVFVDKMPRKSTAKSVREHFVKFKDSMHSRVQFIKGSNGTKARLIFKTSESALEATELMNKSCFLNSNTPIVVKLWVDKKKQKSGPKTAKHTPRKKCNSESLAVEPISTATDVYVGNNLPSTVTENDIKMHFKMFDPHIRRVVLIKDTKTKQSKGFAKVTFTSLQAAQTAIEKLHKSQLSRCKQHLVVNLWKEKKEKDEQTKSPTKPTAKEDTKDNEKKSRQKRKEKVTIDQTFDMEGEEHVGLKIENVSNQISGDQLRQMLESFGSVMEYSIIPAPEGKTVYNVKVYFSSREEAEEAISHLNGNQLAGEKIVVQYLKPTKVTIETFGVYIGRIPKTLLKPELEQIFAKYGKISSVFFNSEKKFGYVNYFNMEDAEAALDMNNREVHGSKLKVNMASKKAVSLSPTPASPDPGPPIFSSSLPCSYTVQIRNLNPLTTKEKLTKLVECYGSLTSPVHLIKGDPPYAYVNYSTSDAANTACSHLHGQEFDGKTLRVKIKDKGEVTPSIPPIVSLTAAIPPCSPHSPPVQNIPLQHQFPSIPSAPPYPIPGTSSLLNYTVKQRHVSAQLNKFLNERMDLKLREFMSFGGSVRWNSDFLTVEAPSVAALNQFETDVLDTLDEREVVLSSEDWNKLMLMRPDKTSLFQQLVLPYRTNPNVRIELHDSTLSICIVGMMEAVNDVRTTIVSELNKEIVVEE